MNGGEPMPPRTETERIAAEPEVLRQSCIVAIRSVGEYAPEIEPGDARSLSAELLRLSRGISETFSADEGRRVRAGVRAALQAYREQAQQRLGEMRQKIRTAQTAMRDLLSGIAAGDTTHLGGIQQELETLKAVAQATDLTGIRRALGHACAEIRCSHAAFVRAQQMVTLQLQDEIRMLRETLAAQQREGRRDPDSGVVRREYLEAEIRARLSRKEAFSLLLLSIHNLERLQAEHPPEAILNLPEAFGKRLTAVVGGEFTLAKWSPRAFALLLPVTSARADEIRERASSRMPGTYAVQVGGTSRTLRLDLSIAIVDPAVEFCANQ
jgi:GGDEF domain-containing protein